MFSLRFESVQVQKEADNKTESEVQEIYWGKYL